VPSFGTYPESSNATTALVLAILGFFCLVTAPVGAMIGLNEKKAIDAGRRDPKNRGTAKAAMIIGFALSALLVVGIFGAFASIAFRV